jgi:hypothetical protein
LFLSNSFGLIGVLESRLWGFVDFAPAYLAIIRNRHSLWTKTMKRCTSQFLAAVLFAVASAGPLALPAGAQTEDARPSLRQFPDSAVRGVMQVLAAPDIAINGKPDRLSPAARIRDANNNLVLSGTISGQNLLVNYLRDNTGLVQQVWILNSEEARQKMPGQDGGFFSNLRSMFETRPTSDDGNTPFKQLPVYK